MREIAIELSKGLNISNNIKVKNIEYNNGEWNIIDDKKRLIKANHYFNNACSAIFRINKKFKIIIPTEITNNLKKLNMLEV